MRADISTRAMRYAVAVADHGGFTRAATALHLSQQALSQHIRRLETDLGFQVFDRRSRDIRPTAAGVLWLDAVRRSLWELRQGADAAIDADRADGRATLRVGFVTGAAAELTNVLLKEFENAQPSVDFELLEARLSDTSGGLASGEVDVAFLRQPLSDADLECVTLLEEPRVVALAAGHCLAETESVRPEQLSDYTLVGLPGADSVAQGFWSLADVLGDRAPRIVRTAETVPEELQIVAHGPLISITATSATRYFPWPGVVFRRVDTAPPSRICVAVRRGDLRVLPRQLLRVLRDAISRMPAAANAFATAEPSRPVFAGDADTTSTRLF